MNLLHGWIHAFVLATALLLQTGCASDRPGEDDLTSSGSDGSGLSAATADYQAGRYDAAHSKSLAVMREASGERDAAERDRAAYLAGLSAFRMRQFDEAETRLLTAAQSTDTQIQGRSKALLGLIRLEQDRPAAAAEYFQSAATMLEGAEAEEARYHAGVAYQQAGNPQAARAASSPPVAASPTRSPGSTAPGGGSTGIFAIQVGAFADLTNAQSAAAEARTLASQHHLGDVRIVPRKDSRTRTLYVVQFGSFTSRTEAENARRQLGRLNYIVAPISRG